MFIVVENNEKKSTLRFPMEDVELKEQMHKIGITKISPVCRMADCGQDKGLLKCFIGTEVKLDEVNFLSKRWASLTSYEQAVMSEAAAIKDIRTMKDMINLTYSLSGLSLLSDFSDMKKVGRRLYLDKHIGMSKKEENSTDLEAYARQVFETGKIKLVKDGIFIENEFRMVQEYDGRHFPFYIYDPDETVVVLELSNGFGEKEYLYMPTDHVSLQKAKARLNVDRLTECRISVADNRKLPNCLMLDFMETPDSTILEKFNELCQELADLSDMELGQLEMILEYVGEYGYSVAANITRNMDDIEVLMNVTDDEQYGRYLIEKSGEIKVDEDVWPFIDYAAFGRNFRTGRFAETGYVSKGFVGFAYDPQRYTEYHGKNRELLETDGEEPENSQDPLLEMSY